MTATIQQRGLGKGLSALMGEEYGNAPQTVTISPESTARDGLNEIPVEHIHTGRFQPRTRFDEAYLQELADSIEKNGVMQPIIVRPSQQTDGHYEIIAGERRWRASKLAKMGSIPAIIRDIDNQLALELALVENIQRQDLTVLEEANGYRRLIEEFDYTQEELAHTVGKSRSHITNLLRLLGLPEKIRGYLEEGELSMGHARALLNSDQADTYADIVVKKGLSVRQTELLVRHGSETPPQSTSTSSNGQSPVNQGKGASLRKRNNEAPRDPDIVTLEETLSQSLAMPLEITDYNNNEGEIRIRYSSLSQLDELIRRLGSGGF